MLTSAAFLPGTIITGTQKLGVDLNYMSERTCQTSTQQPFKLCTADVHVNTSLAIICAPSPLLYIVTDTSAEKSLHQALEEIAPCLQCASGLQLQLHGIEIYS